MDLLEIDIKKESPVFNCTIYKSSVRHVFILRQLNKFYCAEKYQFV